MKTVHKMKVGMTYSRELESNASTGYDWILSSKPPTFLQINSETKMNEEGRIGGNTKTVITIKAIKKGDRKSVV